MKLQWEFQDPKMEVLYGTVPYKAICCGDISIHRPLIHVFPVARTAPSSACLQPPQVFRDPISWSNPWRGVWKKTPGTLVNTQQKHICVYGCSSPHWMVQLVFHLSADSADPSPWFFGGLETSSSGGWIDDHPPVGKKITQRLWPWHKKKHQQDQLVYKLGYIGILTICIVGAQAR